jgi:hypothetical protein
MERYALLAEWTNTAPTLEVLKRKTRPKVREQILPCFSKSLCKIDVKHKHQQADTPQIERNTNSINLTNTGVITSETDQLKMNISL